ncbi:N-succinylarginine dihydrolase [Phycisphaera mikurensis]|uniref:N-succinylarginine dihydrolase n=1 Tax=Phycisphaera mikurensis (strain NBRC 102666 / KCTC 22515 / FYK2301M01) TaxID=1142394 RepID=I0IF78_PHYMF|nr:N-succinylarginine dihydrolase [Phycisphaera mikurensis]MBB6440688.1 succinylarginine dihydrolase [Phycisphaera mikurensis]BAM03916.1 N-succinylarginine dihydrolase [Phycisphaera mikurensis NBRC 102666]
MMEANFDGLIGPTHNFAGLGAAAGNTASAANAGRSSRPRDAALQGLEKMRRVGGLGLKQGFLPPPRRPVLDPLHRLGFRGSTAEVLAAAAAESPDLLAACWSAASMWTANAATATASPGGLHLTPANLATSPHRALEAADTAATLARVFPAAGGFRHHAPLPPLPGLGDEGAANHTAFHAGDPAGAVHLFVHGPAADPSETRFRVRQSAAASRAVARLHGLPPGRCVFAQQQPRAIAAGVFHHDVIGVGHRDRLLIHEAALVDQAAVLAEVQAKLGHPLRVLTVAEAELPLAAAVRGYLFNSQLLTDPGDRWHLIAPTSATEDAATAAVLARAVDAGFLDDVHGVDLSESLANGGGPACLRLRVPLSEAQWAAVPRGHRLEEAADFDRLDAWIRGHHQAVLRPADLARADVAEAAWDAHDALLALLAR